MSVIGIGVDLVECARIERSLERFGEKFLRRVFTEVLSDPARAVPICEEFIRRFPNSDKLPAVREQLERAKVTKR